MMTTEELLDIMKRLPGDELQDLRQRLDKLIQEKNLQAPDEEERQKKVNHLMRLAGSVNTGKVLEPFPAREQLYDENW